MRAVRGHDLPLGMDLGFIMGHGPVMTDKCGAWRWRVALAGISRCPYRQRKTWANYVPRACVPCAWAHSRSGLRSGLGKRLASGQQGLADSYSSRCGCVAFLEILQWNSAPISLWLSKSLTALND